MTDPLLRKSHADAIIERAAGQVRQLLQEAVRELDPFPPFPGSFFSYGIEVEPVKGALGDKGCIVLGPDGELYELLMGMDFSGDVDDPVAVRNEEAKKLDLPPRDYLVYGYNALLAVTELLLERQEQNP